MGRKRQSNQGEKSASDNAAHVPVGYGQPPLASRFKPGTSGNAKGRPKGSKNFKTLIKQAMTASISIQEGQTSRRVSKIEGARRSRSSSNSCPALAGLADDEESPFNEGRL